MEPPRSRRVTSLMDDHCLRGRRRDLEMSSRFDVTSQLNDPSIAFDRSRPASEVRPVGWLVDRLVASCPRTKLSFSNGY